MGQSDNILTGARPWSINTPWGPWAGLFTSVGMVLFQFLVAAIAAVVLVLVFFDVKALVENPAKIDPLAAGNVANLAFLICEIAAFAFVVFIASRRGGDVREVALLRMPDNALVNLVIGVVLLLAYFVALSYVIETFFSKDAMDSQEQMKQVFTMLSQSPFMWAGVLAITVGAPLFEEIVFRGFLLTSLANSRLGFWGSALITSALWSVIHAGYALTLLIGLFGFGILLALMVRRTRSIWTGVVMHGLWNGIVTYSTLSLI